MIEEPISPLIINMEDRVSPAVLAGILNINVSVLYQNAQTGIIPTDFKNYSYLEVLRRYFFYYRKFASKKEHRASDAYEEGDMHPAVLAKIIQGTKTERAREEQILQKIAIERGEYLAVKERLALATPFMITVKDELLGLGLDFPEVQERINQIMENIHTVGVQLIEGAQEDEKLLVQELLNRD